MTSTMWYVRTREGPMVSSPSIVEFSDLEQPLEARETNTIPAPPPAAATDELSPPSSPAARLLAASRAATIPAPPPELDDEDGPPTERSPAPGVEPS
jgi:hypothetical protein